MTPCPKCKKMGVCEPCQWRILAVVMSVKSGRPKRTTRGRFVMSDGKQARFEGI